ncbi:Gfo/Idh/MocA family oxidoreductase [Streptomyces sp. SID13031]|uniref:Gfo/Idh/MocA family protein n=1 Tax=Streptomyces sp. SID13031 TaxID=2706046 RepID=UPI0013CD9088|nr:Gfo/Idh/MocA family oxidoreductase [Streptomyces sp. SID13031]NEA34218.1 Gfo/Idh/MocA family oxidoreductase [Streptomyces sp. SID13031]
MRFGLVGTGPWANLTQGPGLQAAEDVELVGVWGRNADKTSALATDLKTAPYFDYAELLADVDALAFAVPPNVQASMALEAAAVGKHLLLDKPVADSLDDARALADEVSNEGIASVVFFTGRFQPETRAFFDQIQATGGWKGGWSRILASLDAPGNPFGGSAWRREQRGALWDVGPHALSNLIGLLGPIADLRAVGGEGDLVHLVLAHDSGATSTASMTLSAPPDGTSFETGIWGETGTAILPSPETSAVDAFALAATELVAAAESGDTHPVDVAFGTRVVELLANAEAQLSAG